MCAFQANNVDKQKLRAAALKHRLAKLAQDKVKMEQDYRKRASAMEAELLTASSS